MSKNASAPAAKASVRWPASMLSETILTRGQAKTRQGIGVCVGYILSGWLQLDRNSTDTQRLLRLPAHTLFRIYPNLSKEGAIGAVQVGHVIMPPVTNNQSVVTRDAVIAEYQVVLLAASDGQPARGDRPAALDAVGLGDDNAISTHLILALLVFQRRKAPPNRVRASPSAALTKGTGPGAAPFGGR